MTHMKAGFSEIDITPPLGTLKIGWLKKIVADAVLDPLYASTAVFDDGSTRIAFVQLDTLSVRWSHVADIRARIAQKYGFPGENVMVAATHNHAGPAVAALGDVPRDENYVETLTRRVVDGFGQALASMADAEIGFGNCAEFNVGYNRRIVMRDGTVRTHAVFNPSDALYVEGPIDPEVAVVAARRTDGAPLGCIVNFSCHPTHHGGGTAISAGYPGALSDEMQKHGWPVALFLNGACGNVHTTNPAVGAGPGHEETGARLAADALTVLEGMKFESRILLKAEKTAVSLPYRAVSQQEVGGTVHGGQRFVDTTIYDRGMSALKRRIAERKTQPAEVQALSIGNVDFVGIPAEYFVELGLRIKLQGHPRHVLIVSHANGMIGYVPTRQAFGFGGYETTFAGSSRMAPETGDILADAAIDLVKRPR